MFFRTRFACLTKILARDNRSFIVPLARPFPFSQHDVIETNEIFIANQGSSDKNVNFNFKIRFYKIHLKNQCSLLDCIKSESSE